MHKSKSEPKRRDQRRPLNVTGQLAMPREILRWERDLLAVLLEAVDSSVQKKKTDAGCYPRQKTKTPVQPNQTVTRHTDQPGLPGR